MNETRRNKTTRSPKHTLLWLILPLVLLLIGGGFYGYHAYQTK